LVILIASLAVTPILASGGWMDSWVEQKTSTAPGYFEGQKRGYFTGGSFSARVPLHNDALFSINAPRLKTGCGGIDAFMGGFSFLNFDYLVQKLQKIMQAAPAAAFDIALKTLCPQCSETIAKLSSIADRLNGIQLDDCKAAKAIVAEIAQPLTPNGNAQAAKDGAYIQDFWQSTGINNLGTDIKNIWEKGNGKITPPAGGTSPDYMAGCGPDEMAIFGTPGSMLDHIAQKYGYNADFMAGVRGYVGDIDITIPPDAKLPQFKKVKACDENTVSLDGLLDGSGMVRMDSGTNCQKASGTLGQTGMVDWAYKQLVQVSDQLKIGKSGNIDTGSDAFKFVDMSPIPVWQALKVGVMAGTTDTDLTTLADITAKGYAFKMLTDLLHVATSAGQTIEAQQSAHALPPEGSGGSDTDGKNKSNLHTCPLDQISQAGDAIQAITKRAGELSKAATAIYVSALNESAVIQATAQRYEQFNVKAYKDFSKRFGSSTAGRAFGR